MRNTLSLTHGFLFLTLLCLCACKSDFLDVRDVEPYTPPTLSLDAAKEEIAELKQERNQQKKKIKY